MEVASVASEAVRCDMHVHWPGPAESVARSLAALRRRRRFLAWCMEHQLRACAGEPGERTQALSQRWREWLDGCSAELVVVLAMGAPRDAAGNAVDAPFSVDNDVVADACDGHPKAVLGASLHPYAPDAPRELERLVGRGACLVKWVPSYQGIDPQSPRCIPFYEALAHFGLPLLCHTGVEHVLPGGAQPLNHPARLTLALECGVTVIAAHCATRLFLYERCHFGEWARMARRYERFYGDLSAMLFPTRMRALRRILRSQELVAKVVYGSDFPASGWAWSCVPWLGFAKARALSRLTNPLEVPAAALAALGVPEAVFRRAVSLLPPRPRVGATTAASRGSVGLC